MKVILRNKDTDWDKSYVEYENLSKNKIYFYCGNESFSNKINNINDMKNKLEILKKKYKDFMIYVDIYNCDIELFERISLSDLIKNLNKDDKIIMFSITELSIYYKEIKGFLNFLEKKEIDFISFQENLNLKENFKKLLFLNEKDFRNRDICLEIQAIDNSKQIVCFGCASFVYTVNITQCSICSRIFCTKCVVYRDHKKLSGKCKFH